MLRAAVNPRRYEPTGVREMLRQLVAVVDRATAEPALRMADLVPVGLPTNEARGNWLRWPFRRRGVDGRPASGLGE